MTSKSTERHQDQDIATNVIRRIILLTTAQKGSRQGSTESHECIETTITVEGTKATTEVGPPAHTAAVIHETRQCRNRSSCRKTQAT